jgi:hypothetical protein
VKRTVPPSAEIEAQIDRLLAVGVGENPRESCRSSRSWGPGRRSPPRTRMTRLSRARAADGHSARVRGTRRRRRPAFARMRAPECRPAPRLLWTTTSRPPARDRLPPRSCIQRNSSRAAAIAFSCSAAAWAIGDRREARFCCCADAAAQIAAGSTRGQNLFGCVAEPWRSRSEARPPAQEREMSLNISTVRPRSNIAPALDLKS